MMCVRLRKAFEELRNYPFIPRTAGRTVENEVAELVGKHLECSVLVKPTGASKDWWERANKQPKPYIILQPNGSQQTPDIRVYMPGVDLDIECKRSENGSIVWNSGFPEGKRIVVYNGKDNAMSHSHTTYCLGKDLLSDEEANALRDMLDTCRGIKEKYNKGILAKSPFTLQHIRPMYMERAPHNKWLSHPDRLNRERRVFDYLDSL